jgi:transcriptional regulator with XRE-family HTH domain
MTIDALIASRLLALRQAQGLSLAELAEVSGVSKAMISKVERAESSPTAMILGRLAAGLGVPLAQLLTEEDKDAGRRLRKKADSRKSGATPKPATCGARSPSAGPRAGRRDGRG